MAAPKDSKPKPESDHLESLARMLREIEEQLRSDQLEDAPRPCKIEVDARGRSTETGG